MGRWSCQDTCHADIMYKVAYLGGKVHQNDHFTSAHAVIKPRNWKVVKAVKLKSAELWIRRYHGCCQRPKLENSRTFAKKELWALERPVTRPPSQKRQIKWRTHGLKWLTYIPPQWTSLHISRPRKLSRPAVRVRYKMSDFWPWMVQLARM